PPAISRPGLGAGAPGARAHGATRHAERGLSTRGAARLAAACLAGPLPRGAGGGPSRDAGPTAVIRVGVRAPGPRGRPLPAAGAIAGGKRRHGGGHERAALRAPLSTP